MILYSKIKQKSDLWQRFVTWIYCRRKKCMIKKEEKKKKRNAKEIRQGEDGLQNKNRIPIE